jgi:3-isopropylmalate/(R)-2-methylmalate dehydratase small subunit
VQEAPEAQVQVDLEAQHIVLPDGRAVAFPIDPFARRCLLDGVDQLGYLLNMTDRIAAYEATHPQRVNTLSE